MSSEKSVTRRWLWILTISALAGWPVAAESNESKALYRTPPAALAAMVTRPPTPRVRLSPDHQHLLWVEYPSLPSISELAEGELRLAGLRIRPANNGPSRSRPASALSVLEVAGGEPRPVHGLPAAARLEVLSFSPDGKYISFTHTRGEGIELWVAELTTAKARRLGSVELNLAAFVRPVWLPDSQALICPTLATDRGPAPRPAMTPAGPVIRENLGRTAPARTYQDLLQNPHHEALFVHYLQSQVMRIGLDGTAQKIGQPGLLWRLSPSPDGRYLMVQTLRRPFSYLVPAWRFGRRIEAHDLSNGKVHLIAELPLQEEIPTGFDNVATGPRRYEWRADQAAELVWVEALDGGDAKNPAEFRDRLYHLAAPFKDDARPLMDLQYRLAGIHWGRGDLALVAEVWRKTRQVRTSRLRPDSPQASPELLSERSWEDRYSDPGTPLTEPNAAGWEVLKTGGEDGETLYLVSSGASPEGDRPFLDAYHLGSKITRRLFHSAAPYYERPVLMLDENRLLTRREAIEEPPNYFVRDLTSGETARQLTQFPHPTPELKGIQKELIRYQRADGVDLTATLYQPAGYDAERDGPLPLLLWAYPREFKSAAAAGQVTDSPYRFNRVAWYSSTLWLTQGYAVLDNPSMPIVGEGDDEPNDTFREQLVSSAKAAVDECIRRGVAKPGHIAVGGHSYGAFMTANLLAHSDLFAAGIARSGAYNRTLTPFGFQAEERTLWEAPEIYYGMSPFMHAEKINEPLLLIHGEADNNSGTFPMQSERFYNALKGHGATARLVMLPHESHGYRARESILHMLWETHRWLETYIAIEPMPKDESLPATVETHTEERGRR